MPRSTDPTRRELWQARMERYRRSDLTVVDFCRREHVSTPSFYQWKKKLGNNAPVLGQPLRPTKPKFVPVVVTHPLPQAMPTLRLPGGASVDLPMSLEREQLTELFAACIAAAAKHAAAEALQ